MDPILALLLGLLVGVALGVSGGILLARSRQAGASTELPAELGALRERAAAAEATAVALDRQLAQLIDEQKAQAARAEKDNKILQALAPVQETLRDMSERVAHGDKERSSQYGALTQQLLSSQKSEQELRATAESLASALRSNSTRGVWGETQLRRLVEAAGLLEHVDFVEQERVSSDAGAGRIDMVVHLSDGKDLAIDAKVPFDAYLEASQIPLTATGVEAERRQRKLAEHVKAMRLHVDQLAKREYWSGLATSPELVIGFIPSEALLSSALEADPALLDYAFRKNVALASPVTLWAVLKTIAYSWRQEAMSQDAKRIFDLSSELYSRLSKLAEYSEALRRSIESTVNNYNKFSASLESRVLVTARKIESSGDPARAIPPAQGIDEAPRPLTAPELLAPELLAFPNEPELPSPDRPASAIAADAASDKSA